MDFIEPMTLIGTALSSLLIPLAKKIEKRAILTANKLSSQMFEAHELLINSLHSAERPLALEESKQALKDILATTSKLAKYKRIYQRIDLEKGFDDKSSENRLKLPITQDTNLNSLEQQLDRLANDRQLIEERLRFVMREDLRNVLEELQQFVENIIERVIALFSREDRTLVDPLE